MITTMVKGFRARRVALSDDRGSLPMVMLVALVAVLLSSLLLPSLVSQAKSTRYDTYRQHSLEVAQAGLSLAVTQIRAASDAATHTAGSYYKLPCGPFRGSVSDSAGATDRYGVTITYYDGDPNSTTTTAHVVACVAGGGTHASSYVPYFAKICSAGTDVAQPAVDDFSYSTPTNCTFGHSGDRTLTSTYTFATTNANVPGGQVRIYTGASLCWDSGANPTSGTAVTVQNCNSSAISQKFLYTSQLQIEVVATIGTTTPLCFQTPNYPHSVGDPIVLQPCEASASVQLDQRWARGSGSRAGYLGSSTASKSVDGLCIAIGTNAAGQSLNLQTCNSVNFTDTQSWTPDATVGVGNANNPGYNYLLNWGEFSRCVDVSGFTVSNGMQDYPCKQTWRGPIKNVDWNQQWTYDSATKHYVTMNQGLPPAQGVDPAPYDPTAPYCLFSPAAGTLQPGQFSSQVHITPCTVTGGSTPTDAQRQWTLHTDKTTNSLATLYEITDQWGNCLTTSNDAISTGSSISQIVMGACNGKSVQKWNADPAVLSPTPLKNTNEK